MCLPLLKPAKPCYSFTKKKKETERSQLDEEKMDPDHPPSTKTKVMRFLSPKCLRRNDSQAAIQRQPKKQQQPSQVHTSCLSPSHTPTTPNAPPPHRTTTLHISSHHVASHHTAPDRTASHLTALHSTARHCLAYTTSHRTAPHHIALHCVTLHRTEKTTTHP